MQYVLEMLLEDTVLQGSGGKVVEYTSQLCNDGYEGPLCGVCSASDTGGHKYGLRSPFRCVHCSGSHVMWFGLSAIGSSAAMLLSTGMNLSNNRAGFRQHYYTSDISKVSFVALLPGWCI